MVSKWTVEALRRELAQARERIRELEENDNGCRCQFDSDGDLIWRCELHRGEHLATEY